MLLAGIIQSYVHRVRNEERDEDLNIRNCAVLLAFLIF